MKRRHSKAFALPIVLWAVGILSAALVATAVFMEASLDLEARSAQASSARQLALSGIALVSAIKPGKLPFALTREIEGEGTFTATRTSESGRINLNALLRQRNFAPIAQLLVAWGSDPVKAAAAAAALERAAWLQAGADPATGFLPFESYDQLQALPEFAEAVREKPDWADQLTLWGDGSIDARYASEEALIVLGGLTQAQAQLLISQFATRADRKIASLDEFTGPLGLKKGEAPGLSRYFGTDTKLQRIEATASAGRITRRIRVIVRVGDGNWEPVIWDEK